MREDVTARKDVLFGAREMEVFLTFAPDVAPTVSRAFPAHLLRRFFRGA